jgi:DNA-binding transcriptional ArsR family regulator
MLVQFQEAVRRARRGDLDPLTRDLWKAVAAGLVSEDEGQQLAEEIALRRRIGSASGGPTGPSPRRSYFPPKRPRKPVQDRSRSLLRRRALAASGPLPPALAAHFTVGELAALKIVVDEMRARRLCDRTVGEIAARAGVGETTVRNAIRSAAELGLVTVEERRQYRKPNLSNLVRVIDPAWLAWIGFKKPKATDTKVLGSAVSGDSGRATRASTTSPQRMGLCAEQSAPWPPTPSPRGTGLLLGVPSSASGRGSG